MAQFVLIITVVINMWYIRISKMYKHSQLKGIKKILKVIQKCYAHEA